MNFETTFEVMTKIDITERFDTSHPLRENFDARHERKNKRKIKEKQKGSASMELEEISPDKHTH